jgi:hypothetical protein
MTHVPVLKYTLFVGASLLALLVVSDRFIDHTPANGSRGSTSLEVLRKMANHGHPRGFAPLAAAGEFHPMPAVITTAKADTVEAPPAQVEAALPASPVQVSAKVEPAAKSSDAVLNAQASIAERTTEQKVLKKAAAKPVKRVAAVRKPKPAPRTVYVENRQFGFFGTW